MNLQTIKAKARYVGFGLWQVTHPCATVSVTAHYPHDLAVYLLRNFVLPNMTRAKTQPCCGH